jgi:hypothetical protein
VVDKVFVDLVYEAAQSQPDAKGTVTLSKDELEDRWTTSKHGFTSNRYRWTTRFVYLNGDEVAGPSGADERATLVVHDPVVGRLRKTFDVSLDPQSVQAVVLKIRYVGPGGQAEEVRQPFTATGSWDYTRPLAEGAPRDLQYSWSVEYKDGFTDDDTPWTTLRDTDEAPTIEARRYRVPVQVDGEGLDWTRWRTAYVTVTYRDADHDYEKVDEVRLTKDQAFATVEEMAFSPRARTYEYRATFAPRDGSDPVEVPAGGGTTSRSGPLLLDTLV